MKLSFDGVDWNEIMAKALGIVKSDVEELKDDLSDPEDKALVERSAKRLASEIVALAKSETPEEEADHREKIAFLKGTLESMAAVVEFKLYSRVVETVGDVFGAVAVGLVKAML